MSLDRWDLGSVSRVVGWALDDMVRGIGALFRSRLRSSSHWHFRAQVLSSLFLASLCVVGAVIAVRWSLAEYTYSQGMAMRELSSSVQLLRRAGALWPFERRFREASARKLAHGALAVNTEPWRLAAIAELRAALTMSKNSADLLAILITLELAQGLDSDARAHFANFRLVARKSQFLELAESLKATGQGMALH